MRGPGGWWRRKSTPAKVETYTRWSFHLFGLGEIAMVGLPTVGAMGSALGGVLMLLVAGHGGLCMLVISQSLDWTRGRRAQPVQSLWTLALVTAVIAFSAVVISSDRAHDASAATTAGVAFGVVVVVGAGVISLGLGERRHVYGVVGGFALGSGALVSLLGTPWSAALLTAGGVLLGAGFLAFGAVFSLWLLNTVYELDEARETRARLAVAEERLRFGRDLHDVMGRNLAVIALKSELAVQLARRGRPEAVEQMIEVQRIARESQREVRAVVRGYREADLWIELAGAQGVLDAAGIACEVRGEAGGLPAEVQSALGWVVRETTTNVLRHGDADRCTVALSVAEGRVVLTVENDGAQADAETGGADGAGRAGGSGGAGRAGGSGEGSGLAGLRERLREVDGTLEAGFAGGGVFRVVAEVPLSRAAVVSEVVS